MRRIAVMMTMVATLLVGCNSGPTEEEFASFASDFYVQMLTDGEQSEKVTQMYNEMKDEYKSFENESLYENLAGMYKGLGGEGDAEQYRQQVTKILNEGVE